MAKLYRRGRKLAFQALFEAEFGRAPAAAALARELESRRTPAAERGFAEALVAGVTAEVEALDRTIAEVAPAHPVSALALVDRVVLRIALYELLFNNAAVALGSAPKGSVPRAAVPMGAVINEAVELAKTFGSDASRRFVNGVLGTVSRERLSTPAGQAETEASRGAV